MVGRIRGRLPIEFPRKTTIGIRHEGIGKLRLRQSNTEQPLTGKSREPRKVTQGVANVPRQRRRKSLSVLLKDGPAKERTLLGRSQT